MERTDIEKKRYIYPQYVPAQQLMKGLYTGEWAMIAAPPILGLILYNIIGFAIGMMLGLLFFALLFRYEGKRVNLLHEMVSSARYLSSQRYYIKKERELDDEMEAAEEETEQEEGKKAKKKPKKQKKKRKQKRTEKEQRKKKEKVMQELFPFRRIEDALIEMENGDVFLFLRIQANNLDLLSYQEVQNMIRSYSKDIDRDRFKVGYFITDSVFKIGNNIQAIEKAKEKQRIPFLRMLLDQEKYLLQMKKDDANKKMYCIRVLIKEKDRKNLDLDDVKHRIKETYATSLSPIECTKEEIKQMLGVYGNRIFADHYPDSELEVETQGADKGFLLFKKKKTYEELQLPGIYDFKDMIVPVTAEFRPSLARLGTNIVKTYAVSSFLGTTKETNLLARISNISGVSTSIYINPLSTRVYKSNIRKDMKARRSAIRDDLDQMDYEESAETLAGAYRRVREDSQEMYYISIYFVLSAVNQTAFDNLEETFRSAIEDVSITLDDLKTKQKEAYLAASPIGEDLLGKWIRQNIPSESVANLYPFNEPSLMDPKGLYIGTIVDKKNPILYDPFQYRGTNNNILILGMSGVGKTVLLWLLLQHAACMGAYIRNIDFEGTARDFIEKLGGINIDIAGGNDFIINPLQVRIPYEIRRGILDDYIGEVKSWMRIYKASWNDSLLDLFEEFLRRAYERKHISNSTDFTRLQNTDYPILSDVYQEIVIERDNYDEKESLATKEELRKLLLGMRSAVEGADSGLFNRHTYLGERFHGDGSRQDVFNSVRIINFDFSRMMDTDKSRKLAQWSNIFTYITQFVNNNMSARDDIVVSIDELHEMLKKEYMPIINIISSYERRFRKYNTSLIKATQTMDEVDSDDAEMESKVKPLFSQSATKFLFHLGDIDYDKPRKMMNLTANEIEKLQESRSGKCLVRINKALYDLDVFMPEWFKQVKKDA